jgi:hypothetical protein
VSTTFDRSSDILKGGNDPIYLLSPFVVIASLSLLRSVGVGWRGADILRYCWCVHVHIRAYMMRRRSYMGRICAHLWRIYAYMCIYPELVSISPQKSNACPYKNARHCTAVRQPHRLGQANTPRHGLRPEDGPLDLTNTTRIGFAGQRRHSRPACGCVHSYSRATRSSPSVIFGSFPSLSP